ncbi:MAG: thiamine biosynthesis protein ThiF [Deltaproteobacteria bacterium RBG_13_52_11]|nr:MAG: thiamine biosynthesis protein ThiF [Deltaproteobacteria bacterium RBG_13_52_11]
MIDRYSRQVLFPDIGKEGQRKLGNSYAVIIGCGALGSMIALTLVRAGVGKIRIIDRDFIEYHNLARQALFDEDDVRNQIPKAIAAERHLKKVNSSIVIEGIVADVNYTNIEGFIRNGNILMDGLDNFETRGLMNDVSLKHKIPWIYGGAVSSFGMTMDIIPGQTPCLQCVHPNMHQGAGLHTCETAGVIGPAPFIIGSLQSAEAIKILVGSEDINRDLIFIDVWRNQFDRSEVQRRPDCPSCRGQFDFLEARFGTKTTSLCGQNAVQVLNPNRGGISLERLATHLSPIGQVSYNEFMLRFKVDHHEMVIFPDGRAIIKNTNDESLAKGLYAKYIGV